MLVPKCSTVTASGPRFCCWNCRKPQFQLIWLFRLPITWGLVPFPALNCQKQLSQHAAFQRDICASTFLSMSIRLTSIILILQHLSNVANAGWRVFICGTFPPRRFLIRCVFSHTFNRVHVLYVFTDCTLPWSFPCFKWIIWLFSRASLSWLKLLVFASN